ncbi:hypothetical protein B566_EDAN002575 [Ephemera danica]|nr:hypothetical protein B566_EDAN002575 [Ephemera danica]
MKTGADAQLTTVRFSHAPSRPKLLLMVRLLEKIHELLQNEGTVTQRELYYQMSLQCKQNTMGIALRDVCSLLDASPWELGILSSGKGLVSGPLLIHMPHSTVDCSQRGGVLIPSDVVKVTKLESNAKFVLLVEKDAIFQKLVIDENIHEHLGPLIVITGKGFPDIGTRQLVRAIWDHLGIPILALVDADPHGLEIMCVYRFGSMSKSDLPHLTVPAIRWLGIHPTDITELLLPQSSLKPLTDADKKKAEQLLQKPYILQSPALKRQIEALQRIGKKAEIEDVGNIKNAYLTDVYLPFKISSKQYL